MLIGGLISLSTTLAVDVVRGRRDLKHRWDPHGLAAVEHFVEVANLTIGALYDEGRARSGESPDPEEIAGLDRIARARIDSFRVAHARARLTIPALGPDLDSYGDVLRRLKSYADDGFPPGDAQWPQVRSDLRVALDRLIAQAGAKLRLGVA